MGIKLALFLTDIYKLDNKGKTGCSLKAVGTRPSNGVQWSHFLVFMFLCDSFLYRKRAVFTAKSAAQILDSRILDSIIKYHGFYLNFLAISGQSHSTVPL